MEHFMLLNSHPVYSIEMESLLKRQPIALEDIPDEEPPKSRILSSHNSSSSSSIRSQSPDFSTSLNRSFSQNSTTTDSKKHERQRQLALNRSLEEISRELKEIENCFTVAEEVLRRERERDKELYDRERQRRETKPTDEKVEPPPPTKTETPRIIRKKSPPKSKSPVFKIYSPMSQRHGHKSPTFCNSRLYFKNGRIGCAEAEKSKSNVNTTHKIVKQIIEKEKDCPLVEHENVRKVLESCENEKDDEDSDLVLYTFDEKTTKMTAIAGPEPMEMKTLLENLNEKSDKEVGTPIEEEKMSVIESGSVLNEEYRRLSENESDEKIPISARSSISKENGGSNSPEISLDPSSMVRERIRHLVYRFSDRTRRMRSRLEVPPTPSSSASSKAPTPTPNENRLVQSEQINFGLNNNGRGHTVDCSYLVCPIFCGRGHEEDGLDPQGRFYISWLFIVSLTFLYNAWVIPLRSSFPFQNESNTPIWLTIDYVCDFVYLIDVIFIKHRLIYLAHGFWQTDRKNTRLNYMKKLQFKMDVLSLVPLDLLYFKYGYLAVFRVPRLLKIQTFWEFFKLVDRVISSPFMVRVAKTLTYMLYMIHLTACAYYAYSAFQGLGTNRWVFSGKGHPYVRCFAFATKTATSIGKNPKPENEGELLFMTAAWLMGVFVFALLIGQIRDIIATATRSKSEYKQLVDETLEYMRRLKIPADTQQRVKMWFTFTWEQQRTLDESHILDTLPANLKTDIAISVHMQTLSKVQLFASCDEALLRELVLKLRSVTFVPGDYVCRKGEVGKEMYIIKVGEVQVMGGPHGDEVLATLGKGSYFGEISLLAMNGAESNRRTADVRSKGFSNLFVLLKSDLNEALVHYPDAQAILKRRARSLMRKNAAREANRETAKTTEEPDVVINNRKIPPSPPGKLITTVINTLPRDSGASKLLTQGSRKYKKAEKQVSCVDPVKDPDEVEYFEKSKTEGNTPTSESSDLLLCIQNELKNKTQSINLTDNEKKFLLCENVIGPLESGIEDPDQEEPNEDDKDEDEKCNVTVHREM